ncbi:universal stress protein [Salinisphaera orenii]|uniref:universal stress protein n=1 Tax=Salinisphaera orenii TaxID=856731 RepID=UPI000DBE2BDB
MDYANLLLHVEHSIHRREVTRVGLDLADRFDSHLSAVHIHIPQYQDYVQTESNTDRTRAGTEKRVADEARELDDQLRHQFIERAGDFGDERLKRFDWRFHPGTPSDTQVASTLARYAVSADLVIMHKHDGRDRDTQTGYDTPALIAMESSRPVLVLPHTDPDPLEASRVIVGWNGSLESIRAVTATVPFTRQADSVELVDVRDGRHDPTADDETAEPDDVREIRRFLEYHGGETIYRKLDRGDLSVAETLQSQAAESGADLLVMGAYGHSRLREFMLGGVTFELLRTMTIPTVLVG